MVVGVRGEPGVVVGVRGEPGAKVPAAAARRIAEELAGQFKGEIIGPDHGEYEEARQVWNAMADRRPGLILRCAAAADVVAAVNVAREHGLPPSVRRGGHNVAGTGMSDGGLSIDLSGLREVTVYPERKLVHAGGSPLARPALLAPSAPWGPPATRPLMI